MTLLVRLLAVVLIMLASASALGSTSERDRLAELVADSHADPGLFNEAVLGSLPFHSKQEAIAQSVVTNRVTVVPAAHAVGKSWSAARCALHWLYTRPNSKVITTSASNNQLVSVLWGAIKSAYTRSLVPLAGSPSQGHAVPQRIDLGPEWYAIGFSAAKPESFAGFHGENILVIVDEASGVEQPIFDAIESLGYESLLLIGNPLRASGHFRSAYELAQARAPGYAAFHLTAFDSPYANLTDREVKERGLPRGLATRTWIDQVRKLYGEASLYWKTRVLAHFPTEDLDQLIPDEWLDRCLLVKRADGSGGPRCMAIDISKGTGRDRTVLLVGDRLGLLDVIVSNSISLPAAANLAQAYSLQWGVAHDQITYDAGGWAGPDFGRYLEAVGLADAVPYRGNASGGVRYASRRARSAWTLRQRLDPQREEMLAPPAQAVDSYLPEVVHKRNPVIPIARAQPVWSVPPRVIREHWGDFREELLALRYSHTGAKLQLEKKELLVERLGRSPDIGDTAIMMASLWDLT